MADRLMIAFSAFHLEGDLLFASDMLEHIRHNCRAWDRRRSHGELAVIVDQQDPLEGHWPSRFHGQSFDFQRITRGDAILFASCFEYCVHSFSPKRGRDMTKNEGLCQRIILAATTMTELTAKINSPPKK